MAASGLLHVYMKKVDPVTSPPVIPGVKSRTLRNLSNTFLSQIGGASPKAAFRIGYDGVCAAGTLTLTGTMTSGDTGGVINGVTVTVTAASGPINSANLVATAIKADADCAKIVTAEMTRAKVTSSGGSGAQTVTINGIATSNTYASSDTASMAKLAAKINVNPLVNCYVTASAASGVITLTSVDGLSFTCAATGTGMSNTEGLVTITALYPGYMGNACTLTNGGYTGTAASAAKLAGGLETAETFSIP